MPGTLDMLACGAEKIDADPRLRVRIPKSGED